MLIRNSQEFLQEAKNYFNKYKKDYVFIRIPKNASTSIIKIIGKIRHYSYEFLENEVGLNMNEYYTFCIIRNPYDRLVSWFHYHKNNVNTINDKKLNKYYKNSTFKEWVKNGCPLPDSWTHEKDKYNPNPLHQHLWVCDNKGEVKINNIGHYENLFNDVKNILNDIGIQSKLPKLNDSKHKNYKKYYDGETKELVKEMFKKDLELFNYNFDGLQR